MKISYQYQVPDSSEEFVELVKGYHFMFKYWHINTTSLKAPYATDCYDYKETPIRPRSQDECYLDCVTNEFKNLNISCVPPDVLIKEESRDRNITICEDRICNDDSHCYLDDLQLTSDKCGHKCRKGCLERKIEFIYHKYLLRKYREEVTDEDHKEPEKDDNYFIVTLTPNKGLVAKYRYEPSMGMSALFAEIGGICGFWFGFNLLFLFGFIYEKTHKSMIYLLRKEDKRNVILNRI